MLVGEALVAKEDLQGGMKELEAARDVDPMNSRIHWDLMRAYMSAGRTEDAKREKAEIEKLNQSALDKAPSADGKPE